MVSELEGLGYHASESSSFHIKNSSIKYNLYLILASVVLPSLPSQNEVYGPQAAFVFTEVPVRAALLDQIKGPRGSPPYALLSFLPAAGIQTHTAF